jgi:LmbE family N-acetylglucosaminyl deacetylase
MTPLTAAVGHAPTAKTSSLAQRARRVARLAIVRSARDVTDASAERSALVIAPHPDDETLGCGALVLRKRASGARVTILVVTDGAHSHASRSLTPEQLAELRRLELDEAVARLGLEPGELRRGGIEDGTVSAHEDELAIAIATLLAETHAEEVYATSALEHHPDHAAVGRAARRAAVVAGVPLFEYPIWLWNSWPLQRPGSLGSLVDAAQRVVGRRAVSVSTSGFRAAKLHALAAHESQLRRPPGVSQDEPWTVLPASVIDFARDDVELFFPVTSAGGAMA